MLLSARIVILVPPSISNVSVAESATIVLPPVTAIEVNAVVACAELVTVILSALTSVDNAIPVPATNVNVSPVVDPLSATTSVCP